MKTIVLANNTDFPTKTVLKEVLEQAGVQGIDIAEMRKRLRVLDKLDKANGELKLEDAEWTTVKEIYNRNSFRFAHKDLVAIAEAIEAAKHD